MANFTLHGQSRKGFWKDFEKVLFSIYILIITLWTKQHWKQSMTARSTFLVLLLHETFTYKCCKVASSNTTRLEAHAGFFRLLMKGIFDPYVLWPFDKKLISKLVMSVKTRNYTVYVLQNFDCHLSCAIVGLRGWVSQSIIIVFTVK